MSKGKDDKYVKLSTEQDEYVKIYHAYFVLQWDHFTIQQHFQCTPTRVSNAIKWVIDNKGKFPSEYLIAGAIFAIRERLKQNRELLDTELARKSPDKKFIIELNNQLRFDEERLFKLQQLVDPESGKGDGIKAADVLKLISAAASK